MSWQVEPFAHERLEFVAGLRLGSGRRGFFWPHRRGATLQMMCLRRGRPFRPPAHAPDRCSVLDLIAQVVEGLASLAPSFADRFPSVSAHFVDLAFAAHAVVT